MSEREQLVEHIEALATACERYIRHIDRLRRRLAKMQRR